MGIPKFFRYISERWPNISQLIDGTHIPEFDNLYLDMNSILHTCTHGNDDDVTKRLSEEEVFVKIFTYIDHLFHTIKPKKTFYMAIDGVAPRAKMNQQRARRFRTAMDSEKALQKAIANGEEIPRGEPFDSNAITPGTEFMAKLTRNLKYFIHDKKSSDSLWQNTEVILSGHEVPGEGEHKIMQFIRVIRAEEDYNSNTRHCIYGLDADLIILGLSTHDSHFALLREEVVFGRNQKTKPLEHQNFYLLHISILREYLELEFRDGIEDLSFEFDFERVLDDFILVMFVIGNDFLPHLPDLHLNKGAFPVILQTFKEALRNLDGYINDRGAINMNRFCVWLDFLSRFELANFERDDIDIDWFNSQLEHISLEGERKRARSGKILLLKHRRKIVGMIKPWLMKLLNERLPADVTDEHITMTPHLQSEVVAGHLDFLKKLAFDLGLVVVHSQSNDTYTLKLDLDCFNPNESEEERRTRIADIRESVKRYDHAVIVDDQEELDEAQGIYDERFIKWKDTYYKEKLGFSINDEDQLKTMAENYVEGLQWVLYYYYEGCPSWSWYYKYHYAPRISDIIKGIGKTISFDKGKPFKPFQQLMAVLPERSKNLIPPVYRPLMFDEKSPIIDFYPSEVELDKNGKTADWEAVVKISFVDEERLTEAMSPFDEKLSPEEKARNSFGTDILFLYNPQVDNVYKSPLKGLFTDISHNHCVERNFVLKPLERDEIVFGLPEGAKLGTSALPGFPTLKSLSFTNKLEFNECQIFQQPSKQQSMILYINDAFLSGNISIEEAARRYLNEIVYSNWPYLRESKVLSINDGVTMYECESKASSNKVSSVSSRPLTDGEKKHFGKAKKAQLDFYSKKMGIKLDDIRGLVTVVPVNGLKRNPNGSYTKTFSNSRAIYPLQLIVEDVENKDERYLEKPPLPIDKEFPRGSKVIFLGDYAYGTEATVDGYSSSSRLKLTVNKKSTKSEPTIGKVRADMDRKLVTYSPGYLIAKKMNMDSLFLSKITSRYTMDIGNKVVNIGLMVKSPSRNEKVLGYARKTGIVWEYSNLTVKLLQEYRTNFPEFFEGVSKTKARLPTIKDILPDKSPQEASAITEAVVAFIKKAREHFIEVSLESDSLTKVSIQSVEAEIIKYASLQDRPERKQLAKVPCEAILDPRKSFGLLRKQRFDLGDRVTYVQDSGNVPLFSKGTVVGYTTIGTRLSVQVLFDHEFIAGTTFGGRLLTKRGIGLDTSFLLNITKRQFVYHSRASKKANNSSSKIDPKSQATSNRSKEYARRKMEALKKQQAHEMLDMIQKNDSAKKEGDDASKSEKDSSSESTRSLDTQIPLNAVGRSVANNIYNAVVNQFNQDVNPPMPFPLANKMPQGCPPPQGLFQIPPNFVPHPANPHIVGLAQPPTGLHFQQVGIQSIPVYPVALQQNNATESNPVNEQATQELKNLIKPTQPSEKPRSQGKKRGNGSRDRRGRTRRSNGDK